MHHLEISAVCLSSCYSEAKGMYTKDHYSVFVVTPTSKIPQRVYSIKGGLQEKMSHVTFSLFKPNMQYSSIAETQTHKNAHPVLSDLSCHPIRNPHLLSSLKIAFLMTNADCLTLPRPRGRALRYTLCCSHSHPLYPPPLCSLSVQIPPNACLSFSHSLPNTQNTSVFFHLMGLMYPRFPL